MYFVYTTELFAWKPRPDFICIFAGHDTSLACQNKNYFPRGINNPAGGLTPYIAAKLF